MKKSSQNLTRQTLKYYWQAAMKNRLLFYIAFVLMVASIVVQTIITPFLYSRIYDTIASFGSDGPSLAEQDFLWQMLLYVSLCLGFIMVSFRLVTYVYMVNQARGMRYLEQLIYDRLQKYSYKFFSDRFSGALVTQTNRFVNGFEAVQDVIFWDYLGMFIRTIGFSAILIIVFPVVGVSLFVWAVLFVAVIFGLNSYKSRYTRAAAEADSQVTAELADGITNVINIKTFSRRAYEKLRFSKVSQNRYLKRLKSWFWEEHIRAIQSLMMVLIEFFVIYWSIKSAIAGSVSIGTLLLASYYMFRLFSDFWEIGHMTRRLERALSEAREMTSILSLPVGVSDVNNPKQLNVTKGALEFSDVKFAYAKSAKPVFRKLNLTAKPGEKIGLVGPSGGGKTTLTKLILRFLDIQSGTIKIDGQDISQVAQDELRSKIAYVPQEPILFHRSILENIRYGNPEASEKEVKLVAKLAHAAEFIEQLPDGYETLVGERGMKLSGGQKQRVAIARAMLVQAPILLLDEATSALDSKSEKLIAEALDNLMQNRTTLVIAHRLSTIRKMDRIVVIKQGEVVEQGKHQDLLKKSGLYAELWSHQSGDFLDD